MQSAGLAPSGDRGGYLQEVELLLRRPGAHQLVLARGPVEATLMPERDYTILQAHGLTKVKVDAEVALWLDVTRGKPTLSVRKRAVVVAVGSLRAAREAGTTIERASKEAPLAVLLCTRGSEGRDAYAQLRELYERSSVQPAGRDAPTGLQAKAEHDRTSRPLVVALAPPACELLLAMAGDGEAPQALHEGESSQRAAAGMAGPGPASGTPSGASGSPTALAGGVFTRPRQEAPLRMRAEVLLKQKSARTVNVVASSRGGRASSEPPLLVVARLDGDPFELAVLVELAHALGQPRRSALPRLVLAAVAGSAEGPVGMARLMSSFPGAKVLPLSLSGGTFEERLSAAAHFVAAVLASRPALPPPRSPQANQP